MSASFPQVIESAAPSSLARPRWWWRGVLAGPLVALVTVVAALIGTGHADISFRDPDNVAAGYLAMVGTAVFLLIGLDVAIRAGLRTGSWRPSRAAMRAVRRERWTGSRAIAVAVALVSFYVTYMAYRNLKGLIPLLRPGDLFDRELADFDRAMFLGHDPAVLLRDALGTGVSTHVLSTVYAGFIVFLPLSLAVALVFANDLRASLFYATALSTNWVLGAASYFMLPALGPVYAEPGTFAALPHSLVTDLQQMLLDERTVFLADPATGTPQAIAAFASLHIAMCFTASLMAHLVGAGRRLKITLWTWFAVTVIGTVYLGWHYFVDDLAGIFIALGALAVARVLTGITFRSLRGTA